MDDEFSIETPEAVRFGYDIAGIGSRFLAALVDTLLIVLLQALVLGLTIAALAARSGDLPGGSLRAWIVAGLGLLAFGLLWGYYLFFEMIWNGQSPGKRWVGLRVIKDSGAPISFVDSAIRNLVRLIDFLPAYYGIGVVVMFLNDQARRLGDLAAGTLVIRERKGVALDSLVARSQPAASALPAEPIPGLESLAASDYDLIERFMQRRVGLVNRDRLARKLAASIGARMGLPAQELTPLAAEEFLLRVATAYREYHRSLDR
jgi:uncharacterized RDD family membrane protein YckC